MIERRFFKSSGELRADSQGGEMAITGYAATFHNLSLNLGGFRERLVPGCFARSLQNERNDIKALRSCTNGKRQSGSR